MSVECLEVLVIHAARPNLTCLLLPILINTIALCTKVIPLKISAQKSTFTTVFLSFFGFRRRDRRTDFRWHRVTCGLDSERNYPSLLWLQSRENKAFLPLPLDAQKLKGWPLEHGLCPWTPLGALPPDPRYRLAPARHDPFVPVPFSLWLEPWPQVDLATGWSMEKWLLAYKLEEHFLNATR